MSNKKTYLGDGAYVHDDGHMVTLSCERKNGENYVCLESEVLSEFFCFLEKSRGLKITVTRVPEETASQPVKKD